MSSELDLRYETGVTLQVGTHSCIPNSISPKQKRQILVPRHFQA